MNRRVLLPALACLLAVAVVAACPAGEPEVTVREYPGGWRSNSMTPVVIEARSPAGGRLEITVKERYEPSLTLRAVELPAGEPVRVETTVPTYDWQNVSWRLGGKNGETSLGQRSVNGHNIPRNLLCVNGALLAECLVEFTRRGGASMPPEHLPLDLLPTRWQSYAGLGSMLVMTDRDALRLAPEQRVALGRWVQWLGGSLWLLGGDAGRAAADLGLDPGAKAKAPQAGVAVYPFFSGVLMTQAEPDVTTLFDMIPLQSEEHLLRPYFQAQRYYRYTPDFWNEAQRLGGIGSGAICLALAALALLMGPLNFWYVRRRRNTLLFFITTPVLALAGVAAIFGLSILMEGLGGRYVEWAALLRPADSDEALMLDVKGVRPGFTVPELAFGDEALVYPVSGDNSSERSYITDYTSGMRLSGDWFRPRSVSGLAHIQPVTARMRLEIEEGEDGVFVTNNLGFGVKRLAVRLADGRTGWAENVRPGDRAVLARENNSNRLDTLTDTLSEISQAENAHRLATTVWLAAECEGLPYLDGGGLSASRAAGWYYYFETDSGRTR